MAKFPKHEVIAKIIEVGLVPVFYHGDVEVAKKVAEACADGGSRILEFTNRGPGAYQVFAELIKWRDTERPDIILGAGTIPDPGTAALYINLGADFIVAPNFNPEVAKICNRRHVPYIPGCSTPSEIAAAEEMGTDIIKVFPADVLTPRFIKDLLGPYPWLNLMPSGGVDPSKEGVEQWIKAGAKALNIGSKLLRKDLIKAGDFEAIRKNVENCLRYIKEARGEPVFLGVEHVAIYATEKVSAEEIANWYAEVFGFSKREGKSSIMVSGPGAGRIEVVKKPEKEVKLHVAIKVSNFEEACRILQEKGIALEEPVIKPGLKAVYLKEKDPVGNRIHLIYQP